MRDDAMIELLQQVQKELCCPVCKRQFDLDELRVRGVIDHHYLIQASCHRNHHPTLVLHVVGHHEQGSHTTNHITSDDVLDLHQELKRFNGDFRAMFKTLGEQK